MNNFKDIQSIYDGQKSSEPTEIPRELQKRIQKADSLVNNSHIKNIIILSITLLAIVGIDRFYFTATSTLFEIGIISMIMALAIRITIEMFSYRLKKNLNVLRKSDLFIADLKAFYQWRKKIHQYPTYLTFLLYVIGVGLLFIEFHNHLSQFWFVFFLIEFVVIMLVLIIFIRKKIRKEIKSLNEMIDLYEV
jgi:amino acid transporter